MTPFIAEPQIEARCAELWRAHALKPAFDVERLLDELGLSLLWEEIDDTSGADVLGQLIPAQDRVVLNERHVEKLEEKDGRLRRFTIAHEIGHAVLHAGDMAALSFFDGERTWCRDRSMDPVEQQAERFAVALLIPRSELRVALPTRPWRGWPPVYELANRFLVNITPMKIRLLRLEWMHLDEDGVPVGGPASPEGQAPLFLDA